MTWNSILKQWVKKKFRARQVYEWLWLKPVQHFDAMTNLSKELREKLKEEFSLPGLTIQCYTIQRRRHYQIPF